MNNKLFSFVAILTLVSTAAFCCLCETDDSAADRPDHISERGHFDNNLSGYVYQYGTYRYYGTVLNPYTSAYIDITSAEKGKNLRIYVLEGSQVTVRTGVQSLYHSALLSKGWSYSNGQYSIDSLTYENGKLDFLTSSYPDLFVHSVEKAGWLTDRTSFYCFVSSSSEPLIGINLEHPSTVEGLDEVYVAVGSKVRICANEEDWSVWMYYGNKIGLGSFVGNYLRCDSVTQGEDKFRISYEPGALYKEVPIKVVVYSEKFLISYNANGGSCDIISKRYQEGTSYSLPSAYKDTCTFLGWYTQQSGGNRVGGAGDTFKPTSNQTLYAHWEEPSVKIVSEMSEAYCIMGSTFSYTVLTDPVDSVVINVSGASWLELDGNLIYGTAADIEPGTYHVTVSASMGNAVAYQYFDLIVVKKLDFETLPTGGIIVHPVVMA